MRGSDVTSDAVECRGSDAGEWSDAGVTRRVTQWSDARSNEGVTQGSDARE